MAIGTYSELKTAIAEFANRGDLTSQVPNFIALTEASINRNLRHWRMETRTDLTIDEAFEDVPTDWLETIRLGLKNGGALNLLSSQDMMKAKANTWDTGDPRYFCHTAGTFEFWPEPTASTGLAELLYYAKVPALSDAEPTNWLLTYSPDLYLYGALLQTAPYLGEDARLAVWGGLYADILAGLNKESKAAKFSGPLIMRSRSNG